MQLNVFILVIILSSFLHFLVQKVFIVYKCFDNINSRSSHKTLATRSGGVGVFLTLFIVSIYYYFQGIILFDYKLFIPLGIMFIIGVYDDLYNADFKLKFFLQIIVAKILIDHGYVISSYHGFLGLNEVPWFLAQVTTVFVFLVVVNAFNFIDGIDGLAISEVIKTILIIEILSVKSTQLSLLGYLVISSLLPLYYFNFKKSKKVFLGDGGSLFLGTLVMIYLLNILGYDYSQISKYQLNKTLFSVLIIIYPLFDLIRVFILRIKNGQSPFVADKKHIHHFLLKKTKNHVLTNVVILLFSIMILIFAFLITK